MPPRGDSHRWGSILYFFLYLGYGWTYTFLPLIWSGKGFNEHQVGLLGAVRPIASFFIAPVICSVADKFQIQQQALYASIAVYAISRPAVLAAGTIIAVGAVEAACSVSESPVLPFIDSALRQSSGGEGFGAQRLWGAVGYGLASVTGGYSVDATGGDFKGAMLLFFVATLATLAVSTRVSVGGEGVRKNGKEGDASTEQRTDDAKASAIVPVEDEEDGADRDGEASDSSASDSTAAVACHRRDDMKITPFQGKTSMQNSIATGDGAQEEESALLSVARIIVGTAHSASFFTAVVLSGMGTGVIDTFLFIRLDELGGSHVLFGLARLTMCASEVPFYYFSSALIRRFGVHGVIALAQMAYIVRFTYYSMLRHPWWVLPAEFLHGLTSSAMWAATIDYAHVIAPAHLQTTIQGVVTGLHWGLGFGLGSILGGVLYKDVGAQLCFALSALLPSISLSLLAVSKAWGSYNRGGR